MNTTMDEHKKRELWLRAGRVVFTAGVLVTVAFIFSNSAQVAEVSGAASGRVLEQMQAQLTEIGLPGLAQRLTDRIVRKLAHFAEYMLLGFWLMLCLRVYTEHFVRHISWPVLFGLLVALTDETIQLFSKGRSGQLTDVWLDFSGVTAGLLCGLLLCLCRRIYLWAKYRSKE